MSRVIFAQLCKELSQVQINDAHVVETDVSDIAVLDFVNSFLESDLPESIKEAALFNVCNLRTQLVFRIKSGHLMGWEGTFSNRGSSFGSCTHVWNYEHTIPFLFGELAKTMREVEFRYATDLRGLMSFRVGLPLEENGQILGLAAADGQMGTIIKAYRDWQLSGDDKEQRAWTYSRRGGGSGRPRASPAARRYP